MKVLGFSDVCLVGALILALFVAWSAAAPQPIRGQQLVGGWPHCSDTDDLWCPDLGEEECVDRALRCIGDDPDGDCDTSSGEEHSCVVDPQCVSWTNQWCYLC